MQIYQNEQSRKTKTHKETETIKAASGGKRALALFEPCSRGGPLCSVVFQSWPAAVASLLSHGM